MEDVLVVGAGPTELTLAAVLARAGCRPRVIDRAVRPPLDSYGAERRRIGQVLLEGTDRLFGALAGGGQIGRAVRRVVPTLATRVLSSSLLGRKLARFVSQTNISYRHSELSVDGPGAAARGWRAPRSGDRAPDVDLGDGRRLHTLLHGARHTLLLFEGAPDDAAMRALGAEIASAYEALMHEVLLSGGGAAHRRYGGSRGAIYLIRPDGYITVRGAPTDASALLRLLAQRFPRCHGGVS